MLVQIVMLAVLLSGGVFGAAFFHRRFEEILPLQLMIMMAVLYIFGLLDYLRTGVSFIIFVTAVLYAAAFVRVIRQKCWREFFGRMITPAFAVFLVLFSIFNYADAGKLAHSWDEFTHWIDSVKAMTYVDDFITNPKANGYFQSYPPAMALLQYFFQRIYLFFHPGAEFSEWRMYLVFQIFGYSMLLPYLAKEEFRRPVKALCHAVLLVFLPLLFYNEYWTTAYIDPFIAILAGCAFARILYWKQEGLLDGLYLSFLCITLVLSKDIGLYFSVLIAAAYAVSYCIRNGIFRNRIIRNGVCQSEVFRNSANSYGNPAERGKTAAKILVSLVPLICTVLAKWSWKLELMHTNVDISFGGKIDIVHYTSMFFLHHDGTYRQTVTDHFKDAFFEQKIAFPLTGLEISYCVLFLLLLSGLAVLCYKGRRQEDPGERKVIQVTLAIVLIQLVFYIYSLGAVYVSGFSEYEALNLASYQRYMNISYLATAVVILEGVMHDFSALRENSMVQCFAMVLILSFSPLGTVENYLSRDTVRQAKEIRDRYEPMHDLIRRHCSGSDADRIYFISQADNGFDYWVTRFIARPNGFAGSWVWSLGEPQYDGDIWTYGECTDSDAWMEMLNDGNYTHIALYRVNDYFKEHFSGVFSKPEVIADNTLYEKNTKTGLFDLCR